MEERSKQFAERFKEDSRHRDKKGDRLIEEGLGIDQEEIDAVWTSYEEGILRDTHTATLQLHEKHMDDLINRGECDCSGPPRSGHFQVPSLGSDEESESRLQIESERICQIPPKDEARHQVCIAHPSQDLPLEKTLKALYRAWRNSKIIQSYVLKRKAATAKEDSSSSSSKRLHKDIHSTKKKGTAVAETDELDDRAEAERMKVDESDPKTPCLSEGPIRQHTEESKSMDVVVKMKQEDASASCQIDRKLVCADVCKTTSKGLQAAAAKSDEVSKEGLQTTPTEDKASTSSEQTPCTMGEGAAAKAQRQEDREKMKAMTKDLKAVLRPVLHGPDAPWAKSSLLMGLDKDLKFKVWVHKEYKDLVLKVVKLTLYDKWKTLASDYLQIIEVLTLDENFTVNRNSGTTLLPGLRLYLSNHDKVRLTGFFTDGADLYGISTSHLEDLTHQPVWYDNGTGWVLLGEVVSHVCQGNPFCEACLIRIDETQVSNISEYITAISANQEASFISDIYQDDIEDIPYSRDLGLMNCGSGEFHQVECRAIMDVKDRGQLLKDAVVWFDEGHHGQPGESGSGIFWKTSDGNFELVAMYIGRSPLQNQGILISHTMPATLNFFSDKKLKVFNPYTTHLTKVGFGQENLTRPSNSNALKAAEDMTMFTPVNIPEAGESSQGLHHPVAFNATLAVLEKMPNSILHESSMDALFRDGKNSQKNKRKNDYSEGDIEKRYKRGK